MSTPATAFQHNQRAMRLFRGVAPGYEFLSRLLSFYQTQRWRRALISRLELSPGHRVLDLCTGTGGIAIQMARGLDARVVGVDLSAHMLEQAGRDLAATGLDVQIDLVAGRGESLPFPDSCFDAVCFAYLLRYVEDPSATVKEVARVLKPGGILASLDFGVPTNFVCRGLWLVYTRLALPLATRWVSQAWRNVGVFLGGSISGFYRDNSLEQLSRMWNEAGIPSVQIKSMSFGAGIVMWGAKGNAMKVP